MYAHINVAHINVTHIKVKLHISFETLNIDKIIIRVNLFGKKDRSFRFAKHEYCKKKNSLLLNIATH